MERVAMQALLVSLATDILTCCSAAVGSWQAAKKPPPPHHQPPSPVHNLTFCLFQALSLWLQAIPISLFFVLLGGFVKPAECQAED